MVELAKTVLGQTRLDAAEQRVNRALGEYVERHAQDDQQLDPNGPAERGAETPPVDDMPLPMQPQLSDEDMARAANNHGDDAMDGSSPAVRTSGTMTSRCLLATSIAEPATLADGLRRRYSAYNRTSTYSLTRKAHTLEPHHHDAHTLQH